MGMVVNPYWFATVSGCAIATSTVNDAYYIGTVLLIDADGQANGTGYTASEDYYARTLTYNGNAQITSNRFVFDGAGDYITIPGAGYDLEAQLGATLELRGVKFNTLSNGAPQVLVSANVDNVISNYWQIGYNESLSQLQFNGTGLGDINYSWVPDIGVEYDISISWDGATHRMYIDGQWVAETASANSWTSDNGNLAIGCERPDGTARYFLNGSIRAIRLTAGVARFSNASGCYTREKLPYGTSALAYTDPYYAYVTYLVSGEGADTSTTFSDQSLFGRSPTATGSAQNDTDISVSGTPSILINASGASVDVPFFSVEDFDDTSVDMCMEAYIYLSSLGSISSILHNRDSSGGFGLVVQSTNLLQYASWSGSSTLRDAINGTTTLSASTVYHVAIIRQGGTFYLCLDGAIEASAAANGLSTSDANTLIIGRDATNSTRWFRGNINHVRITMGHHRYNPAGGAFTPDTGPYATV